MCSKCATDYLVSVLVNFQIYCFFKCWPDDLVWLVFQQVTPCHHDNETCLTFALHRHRVFLVLIDYIFDPQKLTGARHSQNENLLVTLRIINIEFWVLALGFQRVPKNLISILLKGQFCPLYPFKHFKLAWLDHIDVSTGLALLKQEGAPLLLNLPKLGDHIL